MEKQENKMKFSEKWLYKFDQISLDALSKTKSDLIKKIHSEYTDKYNIFFGNGGDRTNETTPEVEFCSKNNIEMIWGLGGGKIQSSSNLLKNWED